MSRAHPPGHSHGISLLLTKKKSSSLKEYAIEQLQHHKWLMRLTGFEGAL